jgi:tetratricopeptide (TPR) repeat protein
MSKPHLLKRTRIFIGSPGDIVGERTSFPSLLDKINQIKAKGMGVLLEPLGWEDTLPGRGRPQKLINKDLLECHLIVMLLWKRWGSPTGEYSSGFEEEYELAHSESKEMMLYFRDIPTVMLADPGEQLRKVLDFRNKIESEKNYLFRRYEDESDWEKHFTRDLCNWLDKLTPPPLTTAYPEIERQYQEKISGLEAALAKAKEAQARAALALFKEGESFDREGRLSKAEEFFAKAIAVYPAPDLLNFYGLFLNRIGSVLKAEEQFQRLLATGQDLEDKSIQAVAYGNLGNIYLTRGDLKAAEEMDKKSLAIEEELGRKEGMASQYGNLGILYEIRGDLKAAEEMYKKSLAINQELGRKEGMAINYGNLGILYKTRGDLKDAEEMHKKSLAIEEELGRKEGMASDYGNLGVLYGIRGDLKAAEEMLKKALAIEEELGRKQGMASQYGNLGILYKTRGDLKDAEGMYKKALAINQELGRKEGMAINYGNLGNLYLTRGDLKAAEKMHKKALAINEELGCKEGMASQYCNLGILYKTRGDLKAAEEMYKKSHDLFKIIGMKPEIKKLRDLIQGLKKSEKK